MTKKYKATVEVRDEPTDQDPARVFQAEGDTEEELVSDMAEKMKPHEKRADTIEIKASGSGTPSAGPLRSGSPGR